MCELEGKLKAHNNEENIEVPGISKLKAANRIKYGIPPASWHGKLQSPLAMFSLASPALYREVETREHAGMEHLRYVEVAFRAGQLSVREFAVHEF